MLSFVLLLQVLMIISITLLVSGENNPKGERTLTDTRELVLEHACKMEKSGKSFEEVIRLIRL